MRKSLVWLVVAMVVATIGVAAAMPHSNKFVPAQHPVPSPVQNENRAMNCTNATNVTKCIENRGYENRGHNYTNASMERVRVAERVAERNAGKERMLRIKVEERIKRAGGLRNAEISYMKAKEQYMRLKHEYMRLKMEGKLDFSHEKKFCMVAGDLVLKWFDRMEAAILNSNLNETLKDKLISQLEQEKLAFEEKLKLVNETETPQQLREVVKQLREQWRDARIVVSKVAEEVAIAKLERVVTVAEKLGDRLSTLTNSTLLNDYNAKVQQAKSLIEKAKSEVNTSVVAAREDIKEAVKLLREAFMDARQIVREVNMQGREIANAGNAGMGKGMMAGMNKTGMETGQLNVMGSGTFEFNGNGVVVITATNATITYTGELVNVSGFTANNGTLTGSGKATFRGNVSVKVTGENVHMFVKGEGRAYLSGNGTYMYKNVAQQRIQREELNGSVEITLGAVGGES